MTSHSWPRRHGLPLAVAGVLVAALLQGVVSAPTAEAAPVTFASTAVNQAGSMCMDVPGGAATNALQLIEYGCHGGANQSFTFTPVSGVGSNANSVYAPGHNGFFKSPDGTEDMNRSTRAQKITWNADGTPNLGVPVALGTQLPVPSGEPAS